MELKKRIAVFLAVGLVAVILKHFYYHWLLLLGGYALLLIAFFAIKSAPAQDYKPEHKKEFFYIPLAMIAAAAVVAYLITGNFLATLFSIISSAGLIILATGKALLNFSGYKIYRGLYAYVAGLVFTTIGADMLVTTEFGNRTTSRQVWPAPTKNWQGNYEIGLDGAPDSCHYAVKVLIENYRSDWGPPSTGQYYIHIDPAWHCWDNVPIWQIKGTAFEKGDSLFIQGSDPNKGALVYNTVFIWLKNPGDSIMLLTSHFDQAISSHWVNKVDQ